MHPRVQHRVGRSQEGDTSVHECVGGLLTPCQEAALSSRSKMPQNGSASDAYAQPDENFARGWLFSPRGSLDAWLGDQAQAIQQSREGHRDEVPSPRRVDHRHELDALAKGGETGCSQHDSVTREQLGLKGSPRRRGAAACLPHSATVPQPPAPPPRPPGTCSKLGTVFCETPASPVVVLSP